MSGAREAWEDRLADLLAKRRTHGSVYMDGGHLPMPSERTAAREFMDAVLAAGWRPPAPAQDDGLRFRIEVACDGYAALMDSDVPDQCDSIEDYIAGAAAAAEGIRGALPSAPEQVTP